MQVCYDIACYSWYEALAFYWKAVDKLTLTNTQLLSAMVGIPSQLYYLASTHLAMMVSTKCKLYWPLFGINILNICVLMHVKLYILLVLFCLGFCKLLIEQEIIS